MSKGRHRLDVRGRRCRAGYDPGRNLHWKLPLNIAIATVPMALAASGVFSSGSPVGATHATTRAPAAGVPVFTPATGATVASRLVLDDLHQPVRKPVLTVARPPLSIVDNRPAPVHHIDNRQQVTTHANTNDRPTGEDHGSDHGSGHEHGEGHETDRGDGHRGDHGGDRGSDHHGGHDSDHHGGHGGHGGGHGGHK